MTESEKSVKKGYFSFPTIQQLEWIKENHEWAKRGVCDRQP